MERKKNLTDENSLEQLLGRGADQTNRDWSDLDDLSELNVSGEEGLLVRQKSGNLRFLDFLPGQGQDSGLLDERHDQGVVELVACVRRKKI